MPPSLLILLPRVFRPASWGFVVSCNLLLFVEFAALISCQPSPSQLRPRVFLSPKPVSLLLLVSSSAVIVYRISLVRFVCVFILNGSFFFHPDIRAAETVITV